MLVVPGSRREGLAETGNLTIKSMRETSRILLRLERLEKTCRRIEEC